MSLALKVLSSVSLSGHAVHGVCRTDPSNPSGVPEHTQLSYVLLRVGLHSVLAFSSFLQQLSSARTPWLTGCYSGILYEWVHVWGVRLCLYRTVDHPKWDMPPGWDCPCWWLKRQWDRIFFKTQCLRFPQGASVHQPAGMASAEPVQAFPAWEVTVSLDGVSLV